MPKATRGAAKAAPSKTSDAVQANSSMSRVLYRKYRPTKLEDVVGQEQITTTLKNSLKQGKLAHAYLFIGPRGTGKTSVARIFAHAVNDFDYQVEDHYLDIVEIDAASNTGVDNIRELREKAVIAPTKGKYKVYIIDEVHMLTKSASNALLKTLEEPPEHVIFIMATTDAHKVPITIYSRTQVHTFKLADPETMLEHLRKIADQEQIKITDDALRIIVRRGGGSFRDSLSLLDQIISLSDDEITADLLVSALGLPTDQAIHNLLDAYVARDGNQIHQILFSLMDTGIRPEIIASECIAAIMQTPNGALLPLLKTLPTVGAPFPEAKLTLAFLEQAHFSKALKTPTNSLKRDIASPETPENAAGTSPNPAPETPPQSFSWELFLDTVRSHNFSISGQLKKTDYEFDGHILHLYPNNDFVKKLLSRPENSQVIAAAIPNLDFVIHDLNDHPKPKDAAFSQISDIMGNIQEVTGDLPF